MKNVFCSLVIIVGILILSTSCTEKVRLVTGGFSQDGKAGINVLEFNGKSGRLNKVSDFNAGSNPSYFSFSRYRNLIYAINEVSDFKGPSTGGITTIKHDGTFGDMQKAGELAVPNGGPCYISVSPDDDFLLVANYGGGSVAVVRLDEKGIPVQVTDTLIFGKDGENVSHAHMIDFNPRGDLVYATDLGLDRICMYTLDKKSGKLVAVENGITALPAGTGPRHFVFNTDGSRLYLMGELNNTVTVFSVGGDGHLILKQSISSLDKSTEVKNYSADIHIGRDGRFLYATNRGDNTIATFAINDDGTLSPPVCKPCGGNWPRNFTIDPSGSYVLVGNQKSDMIAVLKIDVATGLPDKQVCEFKVIAPSCLKFSF
ncbi:MAG: lactonase family protein [Bacteroidales bacterium]